MVTAVTNAEKRSKAGYDALMHEVCVGLGFCGSVVRGKPLHVDFLIPSEGPVTADQFVDWVLEAEGMDSRDQTHRAALKDAFIRHMGAAVVDAGVLCWSLD